MYLKTLVAAVSVSLTSVALAQQGKTLEERIAALEAAQNIKLSPADNNKTLEQRIAALEAAQKSNASQTPASDSSVQFYGAISVDGSVVDNETANDTSDIKVSSLEFGAVKKLSEQTEIVASVLYEEDETDLEIDIAKISHTFKDTAFTVAVGQDYLPFGSFDTALKSDTLAYSIGQIRETALVASYQNQGLNAAAYVFNGNQDADGVDSLANYGARIAYSTEQFAIGADYITNIADTNSLQSKDYGYSSGNDVVAGSSIYGSVTFGAIKLNLEHLTALDKLAGDGNNSKPSATQAELAYNHNSYTFGIAHQTTEQALFLALPKERMSFVATRALADNFDLGFEWSKDKDYSVADGGTGKNTDTYTVQLNAQF